MNILCPGASKMISTHYGGNDNDMTTDWNYTPFLHTFCWLRLPKEIFLKCWRCKICKDRMCVTTIPKAIIICTKRFSISICDRKLSLLMRRSKNVKIKVFEIYYKQIRVP
jgi:hypothetical protein